VPHRPLGTREPGSAGSSPVTLIPGLPLVAVHGPSGPPGLNADQYDGRPVRSFDTVASSPTVTSTKVVCDGPDKEWALNVEAATA
jgi:hypothetical protein